MLEYIPIPILKDNYVWAIIHPQQKKVLIVDPGEALPVINFLNKQHLQLSGILITHHHWDHTNGLNELIKLYNVPVFGNKNILNVTHAAKEGDQIKINDFFPLYTVLEIPGHTLDHLAYYADQSLFCGDTLFAGGCGRLFEGKAEQLYHSLQKIAALPDETKIYCAHEYTLNNLKFAQTADPTNLLIAKRIDKVMRLLNQYQSSLPSTLKEEKATNPFLRCNNPQLIARVVKQVKKPLNTAIEVFSELRKWKDCFLS